MTQKQWYDIIIGTTRVKSDFTVYVDGVHVTKEVNGTVSAMNSNWSQCKVDWDNNFQSYTWYGRTQLELL